MKRMPSRAPSPTPTAFSGISNYKTDSYRPIRDKAAPAVPTIEYRTVSRSHFDELSRYLTDYLAKSPPNARASARQKLTRLTIQQFHELSTDVYDELVRRQNEGSAPFLPVRQDFHPKRNQARQKLATLPASRFEDLSSDVYFELARRYPEFKEDPSGASSYDERPPQEYSSSPPRVVNSRSSGRASADQQYDSGYGGSISSRRPSAGRRPSEDNMPSGRRSEDTLRRFEDSYGGRTSEDSSSPYPSNPGPSRRKASQDIVQDRGFGRRPSNATSSGGTADSAATAIPNNNNNGQPVTGGVVVPIKSTIEEEYIEVPYGRDIDNGQERSREVSGEGKFDNDADSISDYTSPTSPPAGLGGLSARLQDVTDDDPRSRSSDDYYGGNNKFGRSGSINRGPVGASNQGDEQMRQEYESRIAAMQNEITSLQRDLGDVEEAERKRQEAEDRVQQLEDELDGFRQRAEEHGSKMRALQRELEELRSDQQREREDAAARDRDAENEIQILRDRCERLEEGGYGQSRDTDPDLVEQLRSDMEGLLSELSDLSRRNDELMTAKDSDLNVIRDLDSQLKDYKRKYEQAKTELRSVKATSQIYLQAPRFDKPEDQLPVSPDGAIVDMHITAFLSAIDGLLTAGRSNAPTKVLTPMKSVINAVTAILDDVRVFERRPPRDRSDVDLDVLRSLRERAEATLSNLVTASKTHATSSGLSPISLLDAAASHVSSTITELTKTVLIRKATKAEQDQFAHSSQASMSGSASFSPTLRTVDELKSSAHHRKGSSTVSNRNRGLETNGSPLGRQYGQSSRRPPSANSSSEHTNSPPPIFDRQVISGVMSDDSAHEQLDGPEDPWSELKPYLEAQTEAIVFSIQSVLSSVRSPVPPTSLNENLTQVITIVSSIVAVCNDNFPPNAVQEGNETLRLLSDHANRLSEVQSLPELTKESRQVMAKSSYEIANAMKSLVRL